MSKIQFKVSDFIKKDTSIISCRENDELSKAKTLMLLNDFSQLPVLDDGDKVIGAISWKSIGKKESLGVSSNIVKDYTDAVISIRSNDDFLKYIKLIAKNEFIFVQSNHNQLVGIITTYDMTINFREFIVPFLKLGIIEDCLRKVIDKYKLETSKNKKSGELVFNEYIKLFENDNNWTKINFNGFNKEVFIQKLHEIRLIRNKIAHYKPEGISSQESFAINSFAEIIEKVTL